MATFTNLENAHVFSKAVITPSMSAAAAGNTSAHTVQSKDTWAEEVPFLQKSDLSGVSADKEFKREGYGTVKFHYKKNVYCLINTNNNDIPSNGYVGKIIDSEGNTINQFISPTDVVNSTGQMATVYQPSLYDSKGESMPLSDYIINPSNGLIYDLKSTGNQGIFTTSATDGKTGYTLSFFTYEGAKLDTTITNIKGSIDQNKEELSGKIDKVEADYKAADTIINNSISNLSGELSGKIDKVETDYKAADTIINNSITNLSGKIDKVETDYKAADTIINNSITNLSGELSGKIDKVETDYKKADTDLSGKIDNVEADYKAADTIINNSISNLSGDISSHTSNSSMHVSSQDRELWNKGGNIDITGDNFITPNKTDTGWNLTLNNTLTIGKPGAAGSDNIVPTANAVAKRISDSIATHEKSKNHLEFNEVSFARSGGHLLDKVSNEIKESPKYTLEYTEDENFDLSGIEYEGLIINNKSLEKGLNAFFRKLTIKKVQPINVPKLYAHISRSSNRDITNGLLEKKEYIISGLEADITTSGEITLNFGDKLIISKEYWYGIEFTESNALPPPIGTGSLFKLNYINFANISYTPSINTPTYPSLFTNKKYPDGYYADDRLIIPCVMEIEDYEIPTSNAVINYVDNLSNNNIETNDIIWNLNDLLVSCIDETDKNGAKWVQELLRANANNNSTLISIVNYESIYNTTNIVEATEKWIAEALTENTKLSTDLAFRQDSFMTNQLFRLFFYNLDHKFGKTYGSDDSISRKFMKRGLTFKYLAKVEGDPVLNYPNEGFGKSRYKYIILRYRGKTIDGTDKPLEIDWDHIPTIVNTVNSSSTADTFQMAKAWDIIDSEEYGNNVYINGDNFINAEGNGNTWDLSLNVASDISDDNQNLNEIKNSTVPTANAVKTYVDNTVDEHKKDTISTELSTWDIETAFADGATNVFDFTCNSPFTGILIEVRLYCSPKTAAGEESYLEIRQNDKILARSTNAQYHSANNLLKFNFDNILLKLGDRYGFYIVDKNGSKPSTSCLALSAKNSIPEVANLNVVVSNYSNHTPRFGFTYYKSNREIISNTLNKLNSDLVYDISYKYSNLNNITNVTNRAITFTDNSKIDFPINKITHGKYAFRTKSNTTSPLTEFNLRIIDGGKPGANYDSAYYYERDVRNSSYDEDVGGNLETLGNLINGDGMFIRTGITVFNDDLSCLIRARQMFTNSSLTTFRSALPSLTFADRMFLGTKLTEFKIKLPNLSSAECMFRLCKNLEFVDTCLPNLTFAQGMFGYCIALKRIDLSPSSGANLYLADNMFTGCESLTSVKLNLEYLENAKDMFASGVNRELINGSYTNVTYDAPLLDLPSVINIANTIKDWTNDYYTNKVHEIAIGINETSEIYNSGNSSYKQYIDQIADKNWKVSLYTSNSRQSPAFTIVKD